MSTYKKEIKDALQDLKSKKTFYKQIPNLLTSSRLLSPFIIIPLVLTGNIIPAIICSGIIASTDFFDGFISRKYNIISELGRKLDAVTDKVFSLSLTIPLAIINPIFFINIILESFIGITNLIAQAAGIEPRTIFIGKIKTFALSISIILGYINLLTLINPILFEGIILSTAMIQTLTATSYVSINCKKELKKLESNKNNEPQNIKKDENITEKINQKNITIENSNTEIIEKSKILVLSKNKRRF